MRKVVEVLRLLFDQDRSQREIATILALSQGTVHNYVARFQASGLSWPLPAELDETALDAQLFRRRELPPSATRPVPDWATVHQELKRRKFGVGENRVARLMRQMHIAARRKRRFVMTTKSDPSKTAAPNILDRKFRPGAPNQVWATDITYVFTGEGWLYLAVVLDLFSRRAIGWCMDSTMDRSLVLRALDMALKDRNPAVGLVHHSDRGSQYVSDEYQAALNLQAPDQAYSVLLRWAACEFRAGQPERAEAAYGP